mgnify:CR=1 FL=1
MDLKDEYITEEFALPLCCIPERIRKNYKKRIEIFMKTNKRYEIEDNLAEIEKNTALNLKFFIGMIN